MKIIFFGLGSIGQRHARLLIKNFNHELFAFRHQKGKVNQLGISEIYSWSDIKKLKPDAAFITNPTSEHVNTAIRCASLGMHIFMEKPLSNRLNGLTELEHQVRKNKIGFYTAYCLRFHPVINKIEELLKGKKIYHSRIVCSSYLPHWRPGQDYKKNYSAIAKFGGGVFLDLSHELDYIEYLFGPILSMIGQLDRLTDLTVDVEDAADIVMIQKNGVRVNLHLDYLSHLQERTIKIDFEGGYIIGNMLDGRVTYCAGKNLKQFNVSVDKDVLFNEQLRYFFSNLKNPKMMNNFNDSRIFIEKLLNYKKKWAKKFY